MDNTDKSDAGVKADIAFNAGTVYASNSNFSVIHGNQTTQIITNCNEIELGTSTNRVPLFLSAIY